ncbi:hypothetical protein [Minwuia thermotolerans]|uniref:hypothetical protein n=1 Tax=Minwuia thermotolerans TaxID=2056226 RepID=UPI000F63A5E2|nr:hypothetical protein [Minwuia thermotolerans]
MGPIGGGHGSKSAAVAGPPSAMIAMNNILRAVVPGRFECAGELGRWRELGRRRVADLLRRHDAEITAMTGRQNGPCLGAMAKCRTHRENRFEIRSTSTIAALRNAHFICFPEWMFMK